MLGSSGLNQGFSVFPLNVAIISQMLRYLPRKTRWRDNRVVMHELLQWLSSESHWKVYILNFEFSRQKSTENLVVFEVIFFFFHFSVVKVIKIKAIIGVTNIHESIRKASKQKTAAVWIIGLLFNGPLFCKHTTTREIARAKAIH